ncbi:hypothetical protein LA080_006400 [Diaporthe eres]|nr:hypothetical protein LA080_006400 [Diaporthe eres]
MAQFVPKAATYTLGLSFSQRNGTFYGSPHQQTHIRLTIRLPSKDFAERLETYLRGVKDTDNRDVFSEETVTSHKRDLSIILPSTVHQIETNDRGIILVFDTEQQARTWEPYSRIWSWKLPGSGKDKTRLGIFYVWQHPRLAKAVGYPAK